MHKGVPLILAQSVSSTSSSRPARRNLIFVRMKIYFSSGSKRKDYGKNPVVVSPVIVSPACVFIVVLYCSTVSLLLLLSVVAVAAARFRRRWRRRGRNCTSTRRLLHLRIARNGKEQQQLK